MNYEVTQGQLSFFEAKGVITFEESLLAVPEKGYDTWRSHPEIKKILCRRELGHLIFQLVHKKPIRLLFDRVVENGEVSLESCFQGALLGILFTPTHITFFKTPQHVTERSLLALYGGLESVFIHSDDPFSAQVKQRGYTYGDALKADDYPLIYR